jgi:hypothetical protein
MFVGHYAASLTLKSFENRVSLGVLFLAVQFVDILFFPFVLAGIERMNIVENFTQSTHFELEYMPFTHGLLSSVLWAVAAYAVFRWVVVKKQSVAVVVALAVLSHWLLDLPVHTPDLPLWSDTSPKFGFGLWNNAIATYLLEAALLLFALWMYLRSTLINVSNIFGAPMVDTKIGLSIFALSSYFLFAAVAFWLDSKRS